MNKPPTYPSGSVRALLTTEHVSPATRAALTDRLEASRQPYTPTFFTKPEFTLLRAVCARLTGPDELAATVDVARSIDQRLSSGDGDGWRFADFPDDRLAWRLALMGIDAEAQTRFDHAFDHLSSDEQDTVLRAVQSGGTTPAHWRKIEPKRVFTEMLTEITQTFYAHPLAQEEIGYVGMADLPGWHAIGLNQLDDREPRAIPNNDAGT
jgi:gluconate 2-dehydrogenase gamma chain